MPEPRSAARGVGGRLPVSVRWAFGLVALVVATVAIAASVDGDALATALGAAASSPLAAGVAIGAFATAFVVRAAVWSSLLPPLSLGHAVAAVHLSLGGNHVLPLRMGEPLRPLSVVRRTGIAWEVAAASTLTLRAADLVSLAALGLVASPTAAMRVAGGWGWVAVAALAALGIVGLRWMRTVVARRRQDLRLPGVATVAGTLLAWCLEAVLVWQCAHWAGLSITAADAVLVTSAAVVAQVAAVAPGGIGTYELAAVAAYSALGHEAGPALVAALTAHALKTAYSLGAGTVALFAPLPSFVGRLRLPPPGRSPGPDDPHPAPADAPVVLFLPARDEEATVADVVRRAPAAVAGHPVEVVVVDDTSTDATAARARAAGATVVATRDRHGLGAAVRRGLAEAIARRAVAVAFCDADGEYDPEELDRLVAPILAGDAHYVVGSRFSGDIDWMRPHRRLGNRLLTAGLALVARRPITDGQSGYRALSAAAAARAEIVHDYNYAQVLTLDLLAKGFRYAEVPISYSFREQGRSFVRLGEYVGRVIPAVYRQLNSGPAPDLPT